MSMSIDHHPLERPAANEAAPVPSRLSGVCAKCNKRKAFCSCNSQLRYDPIERWRTQSNSPHFFIEKLATLEKFCQFADKTIYELLAIAAQHPPPDVQLELEKYLIDYLDQRAAANIAKTTINLSNAPRILSFFLCCNVPLIIPKKYREAQPEENKSPNPSRSP